MKQQNPKFNFLIITSRRTNEDMKKNFKNNLKNIEIKLKSLETQLMLLDDSVQALNNYKKQLNQSILEIQTEMSLMDQEYKKIGIEN